MQMIEASAQSFNKLDFFRITVIKGCFQIKETV